MARENQQKVIYSDNEINIQTAACQNDLTDIFAIRAIVFMEDQGLSTKIACDGNDFQATHVLMRCGDEPVGCMRIRWFHDFAQFERTAIRKAYRGDRILKRMLDFAYDHVGMKGYNRIITYASQPYAKLWIRHHGWRPTENRPAVTLSGYGKQVIELERSAPDRRDAITLDSPAHMIQRIEGRWDEPTHLEAGDERAVA
ncbi:MAG: GNAT family N-acetyltransferase [Rhodobacteraceae bacterium]|nr:GNAT family N-acetyltransferase [Paracoccaceae bacterium]